MSQPWYGDAIALRSGAVTTAYSGDKNAPAINMTGCRTFRCYVDFVKGGGNAARVKFQWARVLAKSKMKAGFLHDGAFNIATTANASAGLTSATWYDDIDSSSKLFTVSGSYTFSPSKFVNMGTYFRVVAKSSGVATNITVAVYVQPLRWIGV